MRTKVYIIDEAHMLTKEGANAFLKDARRTAQHMQSSFLRRLSLRNFPPTILSRCQRYAFRRISIPVMIERMREIATDEGIAIDDAALAAIAYRADGGLRDALTMLEQVAAFADGPITTEVIDLAFGATGRNYANTLIDAVVARDAGAALRVIEEASDAGADMLVLTRSLIANFRNLLVAHIDPELLARDLAPEDAEIAAERAVDVPQAMIVRALRVLADAASLARTGANPRLELETALLRFMLEDGELTPSKGRVAPPRRTAPVEVVIPSVAPKERSQGTDAPKAAPEPSVIPSVAKRSRGADEPNGPITIQKLRAAWTTIRGKVEAERPPLRAPLSGAMVSEVVGNAVVLKLRNAFEADILKDNTKLLESAIADVLGADLKVRFETGAPVAAPSVGSTAHNDEDSADELFGYANERIK